MVVDPGLELREIFRAHRHRDWYFVRPGGNWGDYLIYVGCETLARRLGLKWRTLSRKDLERASFAQEAAIYLHGSGGFNPWGSRRAFTILEQAVRQPVALVVQGPQTCDTEDPTTRELIEGALAVRHCGQVLILARERTTAGVWGPILPDEIGLGLDHDTAFHLDHADLLALAGVRRMPRVRYDLNVVRLDNETAGAGARSTERELTLDPARFAVSFRHWIRIHLCARRIVTDRLHSAVAGAILGKDVVLGPGSYHKNRSVWEFSLAQRGVRWQDWTPNVREDRPAAAPQRHARRRGARRVVQRGLMWLRGVPFR